MNDHSELKRLAESLIAHDADSFYLPCTVAFERAATPSVVLALIADNEALRSEVDTLQHTTGADMFLMLAGELAALREELAKTYRSASELANAMTRDVPDLSPEFELFDYTSGVIGQIDNMYAGMRADRNTLQQRLTAAEQRNSACNAEIVAMVESALRRSFSLGQVYWQQADSDSTCQQNKSDQTMEVQAQHILNVIKSINDLTKPTESGASE